MDGSNSGPLGFSEQVISGVWTVTVYWRARQVGNLLIVFAAIAVLIPLALHFIARKPTEMATIVSTALVFLALAYVGSVFRLNRTELRVTADGHATVWYGPLPLMPTGRIQKADLGHVYAYSKTARHADPVWHTDLYTREQESFPLFVGGAPSQASAEALEALVRAKLSLPEAPLKRMTFEQAKKELLGRR